MKPVSGLLGGGFFLGRNIVVQETDTLHPRITCSAPKSEVGSTQSRRSLGGRITP